MDEQKTIWDLAASVERLGGDRELYIEIVNLYLEDAPTQFRILKDSVQDGDLHSIERQAHSLRSASANVGARRVEEVAAAIELAANRGEINRIRELVLGFEDEFSAFEQMVSASE